MITKRTFSIWEKIHDKVLCIVYNKEKNSLRISLLKNSNKKGLFQIFFSIEKVLSTNRILTHLQNPVILLVNSKK